MGIGAQGVAEHAGVAAVVLGAGRREPMSVLELSDGAVLGLSEGFDCRLRAMVTGVPDVRRRVKRLRRSSASLRPFG